MEKIKITRGTIGEIKRNNNSGHHSKLYYNKNTGDVWADECVSIDSCECYTNPAIIFVVTIDNRSNVRNITKKDVTRYVADRLEEPW